MSCILVFIVSGSNSSAIMGKVVIKNRSSPLITDLLGIAIMQPGQLVMCKVSVLITAPDTIFTVILPS